jgi:UDP-N-acetylglucosamine transferase subunit ALG13
MCGAFGSVVLVQWPEMLRVYPRSRVCRPALLDEVVEAPPGGPSGRGTFIAVGTHIDQFDRMLAAVDDAVGHGVLPRPAIAQTGVCAYRPRNLEARAWMLPEEMDEATEQAVYVVCHAVSGMIARALHAGRTPLVMPRRRRFGEHVDDHQVQLADPVDDEIDSGRLAEFGLVIPRRPCRSSPAARSGHEPSAPHGRRARAGDRPRG